MINLPQASRSIVSIDRPRKHIPSVSYGGPHPDEHQLTPQLSLSPVDSLHHLDVGHQRVLGKRVHAADNVVGRRGQGAHLAPLHFPVHPVQPQPQWLVAAGPFNVVGDADGLKCLGGVVVYLGAVGEKGADQAPRVGARGGEERPDAVAFECCCGFGDPFVGRCW
jgi:hypothetical protein